MSIRKYLMPETTSSLGLLCTLLALSACSPYPDDGEFLAGTVFADNFVAGVKTLGVLHAVGHGEGGRIGSDITAPYMVITATGNSNLVAATATKATSPLWTDATKRDPLAVANAQQVFVFDGACMPPQGYTYSKWLDIIRLDRQYPIFADLPELVIQNNGKPGRSGGTYSAIVQVRHVALPPGFPCQSIKRFDTATKRVKDDLREQAAATPEYRLLLVVDPLNTKAPYPTQLGFYNQLVLPYIDLGPVPLTDDKKHFATMPLYRLLDADHKNVPLSDPSDPTGSAVALAAGTPAEVQGAGGAFKYSPICQNFTLALKGADPLPLDATQMIMAAMTDNSVVPCLVCRQNTACPFADSAAGAK